MTWSQRRESGTGAVPWRCALRRVSSESRAGGPADRESDESGEQTTQSTCVRKHVEERAEAQHVKAGDAASGPRGKAESRDVRCDGRGLA